MQQQGHQSFNVEPDDFVTALGIEEVAAAVRPVVAPLVARYGLAGKPLVGVGSGRAYEEIAMLREGMTRATLFDIDEVGLLAQKLPGIARPQASSILYVLADFATLPLPEAPADLLYVSSFTPDEFRRNEISRKHIAAGSPGGDPAWPDGADPVHPVLLAAADRLLRAGGLMIVQSYCGGVDALANPGYVRQWDASLARHGIWLLDAFAFQQAPAVTLWVGAKSRMPRPFAALARRAEILAARRQLSEKPSITRFHGRSKIESDVVQFWPPRRIESR